MYTIYADNICVYSDESPFDAEKVISPKLTLNDCSAGSLEMTIPSNNTCFGTIQQLTTTIQVFRDGTLFWEGRVISEKKNFHNDRVLYCEGALAYLNDTTQPHHEVPEVNRTPAGFLTRLLSIHNSHVETNRQLTLGAVTVTDTAGQVDYRTNYGKTIEYVNSMVETLGGHLRVRFQNGVRYLDYLSTYPNTSTQTIEFGKNLTEDFTRSWDQTEFATAIVPLGVRLDSEEEEETNDFEDYLTVEHATLGNGTIYVASQEAVAAYGWIEKKVEFSEIDDPDELYDLAVDYLQNVQFDSMVIELNAVDFHYLDQSYAAFDLLDQVRVISVPHGMDRTFPVTKVEIPLDSPENTKFTLGSKVTKSLTSVNNQLNEEILKKIKSLPSYASVLTQAKENATRIMQMATNGYITIVQDEDATTGDYYSESLIISNHPGPDYTQDTKLWRWNVNGFGYSSDGGTTYGLAMTMDGSIVADYITTGTLTIQNSLKIQTPARGDGSYLFQVDQYGLTIQNSSLTMNSRNRHIYIDPEIGFAIGKTSLSFSNTYTAVSPSGTENPREEGWYEDSGSTKTKTTDTEVVSGKTYYSCVKTPSSTTNTVAYLDADGNLHLKGTLDAADGTFSGALNAATGTFSGVLNAATGSFSGTLDVNNAFQVDSSGNVTMNGSFNQITSPTITTGASNSTVLTIQSDGVKIFANSEATSPSLKLGADSSNWIYPYLKLGIGNSSTSGGIIIKMANGIWVGTDQSGATEPSTRSGTGLWIDFTDNKLYKYLSGTKSEIGSGGGGTATAVFG